MIDPAQPSDMPPHDRRVAETESRHGSGCTLSRGESYGRVEASRRQFASIAASSPDAIICSDHKHRITFWNAAAERIFGHVAKDVIGQPLWIIIPPAMRAMHVAGFERFIAGAPAKLIGGVVTVPALKADGSELQIELSLTHWMENAQHFFGAIARDVTERCEEEKRLKHAAQFDHLTGLANRKTLIERLDLARDTASPVSLLLVDLDGFKDINDSLGHAAGDGVLKIVADRLRDRLSDYGFVSRLGGDEFVILLEGVADPLRLEELAQCLIEALEEPIGLECRLLYIGACIGMTVCNEGEWECEQVLAQADLALYAAKAEGRSRLRLFTPDLRALEQTRISISSELRSAWSHKAFELYYQPQVDLRTNHIVGAEALIRWNHSERGLLSPALFLSDLENSTLVYEVSEWIMETACCQAQSWRLAFGPDFTIGVNLFANLFRADGLAKMVRRALNRSGLPSSCLELEITENTILDGTKQIADRLRELRSIGVGLAFDDYGTGYASLTMLKDYPITRLKIDRSFVRDLAHNGKDRAIVEAVCRLADQFELEVIAEGIETVEQAALLKLYCKQGQGYLFGRPIPAAQFEGMLERRAKTWEASLQTSGACNLQPTASDDADLSPHAGRHKHEPAMMRSRSRTG